MIKAANIILFQEYHVVNLKNFKFSTWHLFLRLAAEKMADEIIQGSMVSLGNLLYLDSLQNYS